MPEGIRVRGMGIQQFLDSIESSLLREFATYWQRVRASKRMPAWGDIRPSEIKSVLPIVWSWKYDRVRDLFVGRLAGEKIQSVFGINFRGALMSDAFRDYEYEKVLARHRRVVSEPALFRGHGLIFRHLERFDLGERIILPLADDGIHGDGIIGATDFRSSWGVPPAEIMKLGEAEEWFALE